MAVNSKMAVNCNPPIRGPQLEARDRLLPYGSGTLDLTGLEIDRPETRFKDYLLLGGEKRARCFFRWVQGGEKEMFLLVPPVKEPADHIPFKRTSVDFMTSCPNRHRTLDVWSNVVDI